MKQRFVELILEHLNENPSIIQPLITSAFILKEKNYHKLIESNYPHWDTDKVKAKARTYRRALIKNTANPADEVLDELASLFALPKSWSSFQNEQSKADEIRARKGLSNQRQIPTQNKLNTPAEQHLHNEIFDFIDQDFWDKLRNKTRNELVDYYLKADTERLFPSVLMFGDGSDRQLYTVPDTVFEIKDCTNDVLMQLPIDAILHKSNGKKNLLKILGDGGEGKSSFLLYIAKSFYSEYNILKLNVSRGVENIMNYLPDFRDYRPVIILIDNAASYKHFLERFRNAFEVKYGSIGFTLIITNRLNSFEPNDFDYFERGFDNVYSLNYKISKTKQNLLFDDLREILELRNTGNDFELIKEEIIDSDQPLRSKVKQLLNTHGIITRFNCREDWRDWDSFTENSKYHAFQRLYTVVALFGKFGLSVPLRFKMLTYPPVDSASILKVLTKTMASPFLVDQVESEYFLRLRNDTAADDFFLHEPNRIQAIVILQEFLTNLPDQYSASLFRNIHDHPEFKDNILFSGLLNEEKRIQLFKNYYNQTDESNEKGKTAIQLSKIFIKLEKFNDAIDLLIEFLKNRESVYGKTLLASIYLRKEFYKTEEAERLLLEVLCIEKTNIFAIDKLMQLYSQYTSDRSKLHNFIKELPSDVKKNSKTLFAMIRRYISVNDLVNAYINIGIYLKNDPAADISAFYNSILSKNDHSKTQLFKHCVNKTDISFGEIILDSIRSLKKCREIQTFLENKKSAQPDNLSIIYLLIKTYRKARLGSEEVESILEYLKIDCYGKKVRGRFKSWLFSKNQFRDQQYLEIEDLFKKLVTISNRQDDKRILIKLYIKWSEKKLVPAVRTLSSLTFVLQALDNAIYIAESDISFNSILTTLIEKKKSAMKIHNKLDR